MTSGTARPRMRASAARRRQLLGRDHPRGRALLGGWRLGEVAVGLTELIGARTGHRRCCTSRRVVLRPVRIRQSGGDAYRGHRRDTNNRHRRPPDPAPQRGSGSCRATHHHDDSRPFPARIPIAESCAPGRDRRVVIAGRLSTMWLWSGCALRDSPVHGGACRPSVPLPRRTYSQGRGRGATSRTTPSRYILVRRLRHVVRSARQPEYCERPPPDPVRGPAARSGHREGLRCWSESQ